MNFPEIHHKRTLSVISVMIALGIVFWKFLTPTPIDYNAQVKPILNQKCISCHGGVKKKGGFSLLFREEALSPTESGHPAIVPGNSAKSEMIKRLHATDPEERMPYKEPPLTKEEIVILTQWIDEGAPFNLHWSYQPVQLPKVPTRSFFEWFSPQPTNEIDQFIDAQLSEKGLSRSEEASKSILLRRVSLDLIGIPAPDALASQFLSDPSENAYESLVDSLLRLPQFGERWTAIWMDLARYADTKGYERDYIRTIWRYRDWLIKAFNEDKPYDQFLIEQLAGDLLPDPSDEQFLATAFHRNTMTNDEGGTDNEEFRTAAVIDRVNTTWEALMGTSFACVQCHSHPYDPFRHEDYYRFMAYFNESRDEDTYDEYPLLREFQHRSRQQFDSLMTWLKTSTNKDAVDFYRRMVKTGRPCINSIANDSMSNAALEDTKFLRFRKNSLARFPSVDFTDKPLLLIRMRSGVAGGKLSVVLDQPNGKPIAQHFIPITKGEWDILTIPLNDYLSGKHDVYFTYTNPSLKNNNENGTLVDWLTPIPAFPSANNSTVYFTYFINLLNEPDALFTPIMEDNPAYMKRNTYVFERGNWLMKSKQVQAGVPAVLKNNQFKNMQSRLEMAMWMTDKQHPLVSRTMVNRLWEQLFGQGIVETLEDLGSQGMHPTHQDLLDFLSYRFMYDDDWSIKKTLKRMVMSATYRQSSVASQQALKEDPLNKLYAHAPRVRLTAEQIRDQALCITGKMSTKMYGPSVMPYQPDGIWASPYDGRSWKKSEGEDQYRRAIYTYWKRTGPYPSFISFDGTAREVCTARRIRTNTPLQALALLNDSTYWDLSVQWARQLLPAAGADVGQAIEKGYHRATGSNINVLKKQALVDLFSSSLQRISAEPERLKQLLSDSSNQPHAKQLAALAIVTNSILNLDEVITKN